MADDEKTEKPQKLKGTMSGKMKLSVFLAVACLSFQFGYNIAAPNSAKNSFNQVYYEGEEDARTNPEKYEDSEALKKALGYHAYWSNYVVAPMPLGALAGSLGVGPIANKFGPKGCMLYINAVSLFAGVFYYLASVATPIPGDGPNSNIIVKNDNWINKTVDGQNILWDEVNGRPWRYSHVVREENFPIALILLTIARFLIGGFVGLASGVAPRYIMEISHKSDRGTIGVLNQLFVTVGILIAQTAGLDSVFGDNWFKVFAMPCLLSVVGLAGLALMPESPAYLHIVKKEDENARQALQLLRDSEEIVEAEMKEIDDQRKNTAGQAVIGPLQLLKMNEYRWQVLSVIAMHMCQQLSGINAVFFYTDEILKGVGIQGKAATSYTMGIGGINVFMTIVSVYLIEKMGRKRLLTGGYGIMIFWMALLIFILKSALNADKSADPSVALPYTAVCGYIVGFAVGPGPVPWIYNTELFDQKTSGSSGILGCVANWASGYLLSLFFRPLQASIQQYVFLPFIMVSAVALAWLFKIIPETKGKKPDETFNDFAHLNKVNKRQIDDENIPLKDIANV